VAYLTPKGRPVCSESLAFLLRNTQDIKWEDIIDTTIYRYAKLLNPPITLQSWYEGETKDSSPEPAPEKASTKSVDNGHKLMDINSKEFEKLVAVMIVETINEIQTGKLEI